MSFAFPAADIAPLAWFMPAALILTAERVRLRRALGLGWVFGVAFFGSVLVWISLVGWIAWALLVAVQALFVALFAGSWSLISPYGGRAVRILAPAVLWVASEWLRSTMPVHGFTWGVLAQSQHNLPWMLRLGAIGGGWLISFVCVLIAGLATEAVRTALSRRWRATAWCAAAAALCAGLPALIPATHASGRSIDVVIVQGNVPANSIPGARATELAILRSHVRLTTALEGRHPDLVVWPESAVGLDPFHDPVVARALRVAARAADAPMLVGADVPAGPGYYRVVTLEVTPGGRIAAVYRKTHLVPFGEYIPYRRYLRWAPMLRQVSEDAVAADHGRLFHVAGGEVAPVLSFEDDFSSLVRGRIAMGGRLLVVGTNTSTWGRSWASEQHVAMSQVNAAANGVWVVHGALSGISAFVDPQGHVVARSALWEATTLSHHVSFRRGETLYTRYGDWTAFASLALGGAAVVYGLARRAWARRRDTVA